MASGVGALRRRAGGVKREPVLEPASSELETAAKSNDAKSIVNSVLRACRVVELLAEEGPGVTLFRVAQATGLTRPTAHRLLATLEQAGWVSRTTSGQYALTTKMFLIGTAASSGTGLRQLASPALTALAMSTGDTAYLLVPYEGRALCIDRIEGPHPIRVHHVNVGDTLPLTSGAAPLAVLAFRPDMLDMLSVPAHQRARVRERIALAREQGYVVSPDDLLPGVTAIGAPVFDREGTAVAGISITGTNDRFSPERIDKLIHAVKATAAEISALLGYRPAGQDKRA